MRMARSNCLPRQIISISFSRRPSVSRFRTAICEAMMIEKTRNMAIKKAYPASRRRVCRRAANQRRASSALHRASMALLTPVRLVGRGQRHGGVAAGGNFFDVRGVFSDVDEPEAVQKRVAFSDHQHIVVGGEK